MQHRYFGQVDDEPEHEFMVEFFPCRIRIKVDNIELDFSPEQAKALALKFSKWYIQACVKDGSYPFPERRGWEN